MLKGQVIMPCTVSGVAIPPTVIPSAMKKARASSVGMYIGAPASAAIATATIAPAIHPAGKCARSNTNPPAPAISRVCARCNGFAGSAGLTACPCLRRPMPSNDGQVCASVMTYAHAAGLVGHRGSARLYRAPLHRRELRGSHPPRRSPATTDLSAFARDLLHLVDIFRLGRASLPHGL